MRFDLLSIPVTVRGSFVLVAAMLAFSRWSEPVLLFAWILIVFGSILLHELGHAAAFAAFGHRPSIELGGLGGLTRGSKAERDTPLASLLIALAGPAAGFAVGGAVWLLAYFLAPAEGTALYRIILDLLWVNVGWGALNLLPIWPLDGSHALLAVLGVLMPAHALRVGLLIGTLVAAVAVGAALIAHLPWAALLAAYFGALGFGRLRRVWSRGRDAPLEELVHEGYLHLGAERIDVAAARAQEVLEKATNAEVRRDAAQLLAWSHLAADRPEDALAALSDPTLARPDPALEGRILVRIPGREREAVAPLLGAFAREPSSELGRDVALALAHADDPETAARVVEGREGRAFDDAAHAQIEAALFFDGHHAHSLRVSALRFERYKSADAAYNAACASARLGERDRAVEWLEKAIRAGYSDLVHMRGDEDLAALRGAPAFERLLAAS